MQAIKMTSLAMLTALMATAFAGSTSAMAETTSFCSVDENPCSTAHQVGSVHETSIGWAKLLTSIGTAECLILFSGEALGSYFAVGGHVVSGTPRELGSPLFIIGNFTYTGCVLGGSFCTVTEEGGPAEIKVLKESHETAKVTGEALVHIVCSGFIDCSFNGTGLVGTAKGPLLSAQVPDNGEVSLSEQSTTKEAGGFLCPKTAKLDLTTTPLSATYISS